MSWDPEYLQSAALPRFNPWPIKYLLPVWKWWPLYWPNDTWEVIPFPPTPGEAPQIPDGLAVPWWKTAKSTWPYELPFEPKVFGCWPASQISSVNDLRNPPFGYIKLKMRGEQQTGGNQIAFTQMKIHMRHLTRDQMKVMTAVTSFGPKFYLRSKTWDQYEKQAAEVRAGMKQKWRNKLAKKVVERIAETDGKPGLIAERLAAEIIKIEERPGT